VLDEIEDADTATAEVAVAADGSRRTPRLVPAGGEDEAEAGELAEDDVIVVTGGARGVTAACVRALASGGRGEFILLGRTEHDAVPAWAAGLSEPDLKSRLIESMRADGAAPAPRDVERRFRELLARREIQETLDAVEATGARARYVAVDVTDADAVRAALADDAPRVTGLVHGAGALADALLADKTPEDVRTVLGAKLTGLRAVLDALDTAPLRHVVLFASVAGVYGNAGQADYAVANQALGRLAASWKRAAPERRVTAIDWGAWDGGMVTPDLREVFQARGVALLPLDEGAARFAEQFSASRHDDVEVLIGQAAALAAPPEARPGRKLLARRDLTGLGDEPIIGDHRIGEHPVLPASAALGWMISTLERAHPGLGVIEARGFDVQRGVVFDGSEEPAYWLSAEPGERDAGGRLTVTAAVLSNIDATPQSHYRGTFVLAPRPAPAPSLPGWPGYAVGEGEENGLRAYTDADLFHGPLLQGVRRLLEREPRRLVAECRLPDPPLARGAYAGALHSPVLGDVVLQAAAVLGVWFMDAGCLPLAFKSWEFFEPLPGGAPFVAVVDNLRDAPMTVTVDVSVCDVDGRVLQRLTDVTVVATPDMRAKFAEAVARRREAAETEKAR
jgi:NAD(P)-dependent dehydrogenase (short-subunit alcohol dehydrogenase family)